VVFPSRYSEEAVDLVELYEELDTAGYSPRITFRGVVGMLSPGMGPLKPHRSGLGKPTRLVEKDSGTEFAPGSVRYGEDMDDDLKLIAENNYEISDPGHLATHHRWYTADF